MTAMPHLQPAAIPKGIDPQEWRRAIEARLNELLDQSLALITALDMMEVDPDFEPDTDGEPWLGWTDRCQCGIPDDREAEDEHGGDILDEPHDQLDQGDDEPTLGWSNVTGQQGVGLEGWSMVEGEPQ